MSNLEKDREIKTLSTIQHILLRPNVYIGAMKPTEKEVWLLNEDESIILKKVLYSEGLLKIINEAIDNSFDEFTKTDGKFATKLEIKMSKDSFSIRDNGRGIPVIKTKDGEYMCVTATCRPMSGSNFEDNDKSTIGTNGIGIKASNIFSKQFECITDDGKNKMKITCTNNLSTKKATLLKSTGKSGTTISFSPDFERFSVKEFDDTIFTLVKTRLKFLAWFFPKCTILFNGTRIVFRAKDISQMFPQPAVTINEPNVLVVAYPSEEPCALSYVNGLYLRENGSHVDYIANKIIYDIREKVSKKYKSIKPADIRNRLGIVVFLKNFMNCTYRSQTKEELTNSAAEIGEYLRINNIDLDAFTKKILYTKPIIENIVELFKLKEELAEKKQLAALSKTKKEVVSDKYFPPVSKTGQRMLMITEGFSAFSGISPILGRKGIGYYMLRGKPMNILDTKPTGKNGYMNNQEISELVNILGLDINGNTEDMNYDYAVILSDADPDGVAIAGLIITLFSKLAPKMLEAGRICRLNTPLLIGLKGNKIEEYHFNFPNEADLKKGLTYQYLKGLGSWTKDRLNQVIEKEGGMEKLLLHFSVDENAEKTIVDWFGFTTDARKEALRGREFHINNA